MHQRVVHDGYLRTGGTHSEGFARLRSCCRNRQYTAGVEEDICPSGAVDADTSGAIAVLTNHGAHVVRHKAHRGIGSIDID